MLKEHYIIEGASPAGGEAPVDESSVKTFTDAESVSFLKEDKSAMKVWQETKKISEVNAKDYVSMHVVGGVSGRRDGGSEGNEEADGVSTARCSTCPTTRILPSSCRTSWLRRRSVRTLPHRPPNLYIHSRLSIEPSPSPPPPPHLCYNFSLPDSPLCPFTLFSLVRQYRSLSTSASGLLPRPRVRSAVANRTSLWRPCATAPPPLSMSRMPRANRS